MSLRRACFMVSLPVGYLAGSSASRGHGLETVCLGAASAWLVLVSWADWSGDGHRGDK